MSAQAIYLYEFLYRGRAPEAAELPAYHVVLAQDAMDGFGTTSTATSKAMTPAEAKDKGFDLPEIIAAIDTGTMAENEVLRQEMGDLQAKLAETEARADALEARLDGMTSAAQPIEAA